jgi:hypothetical protein
MDWLELESFGLDCPRLADELVGREAFEGFEPSSEIAGGEEVGEVAGVNRVIGEGVLKRLVDCCNVWAKTTPLPIFAPQPPRGATP